jgi:peptide deformylase
MVDEALREKIAAMFDTMYESHGIGLAGRTGRAGAGSR